MLEKDVNPSGLLEVLDVTRIALESKSVDELRKEVLRCFEKVFSCSSSNFFLTGNYPHLINLDGAVSRGIAEETVRLFGRCYQIHDPFLRRSILLSDTTVTVTEEIVHFNKFLKSQYYNDFLKPQSIYHQMTLYLRKGNKLLGLLAMFRPKDKPGFSCIEKNKAFLMVPYLVGTLEKTIALDNTYLYENIINAVASDLLYDGLIILDSSLKPIFHNENAAGIMRSLHEMSDNKDEPPALPDEVYGRCKALLSSASHVESDQPFHDEMELPLPKLGQQVSVRLRLTKAGEKDPLLLVYLEPPDNTSDRIECLMRRGLSRREYEVAFLVAKGLRNAEIAEKLFISVYTVDNHLRSIYQKLGVRNRTSLAHCLLQVH